MSSQSRIALNIFAALFLLFAPFVVVVTYIVAIQSDEIEFIEDEISGTRLLKVTARLLDHLQQHRGITQIYLSGMWSGEESLGRLSQEISENFHTIEKAFPEEWLSGDLYTKFGDIRDRWTIVDKGWRGQDPAASFTAHTGIVDSLLVFIREVANRSNLILDPSLPTYYLMETAVRNLPEMMEQAGRWRGLKSGILAAAGQQAAHKPDSSEHLLSRSSEIHREIGYGMQISIRERPDIGPHILPAKTAFDRARERLLAFAGVLDNPRESPSISGFDIFETATDLTGAGYALHAAVAGELNRLLNERLDGKLQQRLLAIIGVLCVAAIALAFGLWVIRNVTRPLRQELAERKRVERALRTSEEQTRSIVENVAEGIVTIEKDGQIRSFNAAAGRIFGYSPDEAIGQSFARLLPQNLRRTHGNFTQIHSLISISRSYRSQQLIGLRKDGSTFDMTLSFAPMLLDGEQVFVAVCSDDTVRRQRENDLVEARNQAEAASRAKSEFLATMSHEIRTPMNGVMAIASTLLDDELATKQRMQIQVIKDSGEALLSILGDILDLSKIEAGLIELEVLDFDLQKLLDIVTALWQSRLDGKGLAFTVDVAPDVAPALRSDPGRIRQILFNLLGNATKFTENGSVTVRITQRALEDGRLEILFAVTDTGIGIAPEMQSHMFERFSQADSSTTRRYGGTGLGLPICKELASLLGGEIGIESELGNGTTIWFTIRCEPGNIEAAEADLWDSDIEHADIREEDHKLRILGAEDNNINQLILRTVVEKAGHTIDLVNDGVEAVAAVMRTSYDVVLMDIHMPEMDGVTATRKIRELPGEQANIPIIAVTANAMKGDRENYLAAGMTDYVTKPIEPKDLFSAIRRCTGHHVSAGDSEEIFPELHNAPPQELSEDATRDLDDLMSDLDDVAATLK